eukprot:TRINITY_DN33784_c0_g1_i1.p1 TRINITY_DN33784_c0_g1~~TRINITY_DN33784_c0_g1_i1.p1  ORF type:complete len:1279 (+),score=241.13 TRINITY_DN33784_c0_g1_i1:134-3970(+)
MSSLSRPSAPLPLVSPRDKGARLPHVNDQLSCNKGGTGLFLVRKRKGWHSRRCGGGRRFFALVSSKLPYMQPAIVSSRKPAVRRNDMCATQNRVMGGRWAGIAGDDGKRSARGGQSFLGHGPHSAGGAQRSCVVARSASPTSSPSLVPRLSLAIGQAWSATTASSSTATGSGWRRQACMRSSTKSGARPDLPPCVEPVWHRCGVYERTPSKQRRRFDGDPTRENCLEQGLVLDPATMLNTGIVTVGRDSSPVVGGGSSTGRGSGARRGLAASSRCSPELTIPTGGGGCGGIVGSSLGENAGAADRCDSSFELRVDCGDGLPMERARSRTGDTSRNGFRTNSRSRCGGSESRLDGRGTALSFRSSLDSGDQHEMEKAAGLVRQHFREALRAYLAESDSVQTLEAQVTLLCRSGAASSAARFTGDGASSPVAAAAARRHSGIRLLLSMASSLRRQDNPKQESSWRAVFQQIVRQEAQHRRFALVSESARVLVQGCGGCGASNTNISAGLPPVRSPLGHSDHSGASGGSGTIGTGGNGGVMGPGSGSPINPGHGQDALLSAKSSNKGDNEGNHTHGGDAGVRKDPNKELRWHLGFARFVKGGRLYRDELKKAMELSGFPVVNSVMADESYEEVCLTSGSRSLCYEDYARLLAKMEQKQRAAYLTAFQKADLDDSGRVDIEKLLAVVRSFGIEPTKSVIDDVIDEVDADHSGQLSFEAFEKMLHSLIAGEGFTRHERETFATVLKRFDKSGHGRILMPGLMGALGWLGYTMTTEKVESVVQEVVTQVTGGLDYQEFLVFMRRASTHETKALDRAIADFDTDGRGTLSIDALEQLLLSMGYMANIDAIHEAVQDAGAVSDLTLSDLIEFLSVYRRREGLTQQETVEVDEAFKRYDTHGRGEMSTVDVGKALRWLGYNMSFEEQRVLIEEVDVDGSGKIDACETRKLVRMHLEKETQRMKKAFHALDEANCGYLSISQAMESFTALDLDSRSGKLPAVSEFDMLSEQGLDLPTFLRIGHQFKTAWRHNYRRSGGFTNQEVNLLHEDFKEFDTDGNGKMSFSELGVFIKRMFPVVNSKLRPRLDELWTEINAGASRSLSFGEFLRLVRQLLDIQASELLAKETAAAEATGFSQDEVRSFRGLFLSGCSSEERVLVLDEVKQMVSGFCALGERNARILAECFKRAQIIPVGFGKGQVTRSRGSSMVQATRAMAEGERDFIDFPEFLYLMRDLLRQNFGNISSGQKGQVQRPSSGKAPREGTGRSSGMDGEEPRTSEAAAAEVVTEG